MEVIKDAFDAFSERIRSPFVGSVVIALLLWNWKLVWYLLFADVPVVDKLAFVESQSRDLVLPFVTISNWSLYGVPFIVGIGAAIAMPWVRYVGAEIAKLPNGKLKALQADEARSRRIAQIEGSIAEERAKSALRVAQLEMAQAEEQAKNELETAKEQAVIKAAQRLEEAREIGEDAEEELREAREDYPAITEERPVLSIEEVSDLPFANEILEVASGAEAGRFEQNGYCLDFHRDGLHGVFSQKFGENHRDALLLSDTIGNLVKAGLLSKRTGGQFEITASGYDLLDELRALKY